VGVKGRKERTAAMREGEGPVYQKITRFMQGEGGKGRVGLREGRKERTAAPAMNMTCAHKKLNNNEKGRRTCFPKNGI